MARLVCNCLLIGLFSFGLAKNVFACISVRGQLEIADVDVAIILSLFYSWSN